jgi:hypothetical protein
MGGRADRARGAPNDDAPCPNPIRNTRCFVSDPVIVNNRDGGNNGLLLGIVLTIVVLAGAWYFIFGPGSTGSGGNGNGNGGGGGGAQPTIALPAGT